MAESTRDYWRRTIAEQEKSGRSVRQYCREAGVGERSFHGWRRRLRDSEPVRFALVDTVALAARGPDLELVLAGGERLLIGPGVDPARLRAVVEAIRR